MQIDQTAKQFAYMVQIGGPDNWHNLSRIAMGRDEARNEAKVQRRWGERSRVVKLELGE